MKNRIKLLGIIILFSAQHTDAIRRAIIDIGSVGTKIEIADVDEVQAKIQQVLLFTEMPVYYKHDIEHQDQAACFRPETIETGLETLKKLKALAQSYGVAQTRGIATAGLRAVACANDLVKSYERELNIPIDIISQDEEARLAFFGILAQLPAIDKNNLVSWETGGGSMQMATLDANGKLVLYGARGLVPFRNEVMRLIQNKTSSKTPNPLLPGELEKACTLASLYAQNVPEIIRHKLQQPSTIVVGTGAINNSVHIGTQSYDRQIFCRHELEDGLAHLAGTPDDVIRTIRDSGLDPSLGITGLALVVGYMQALGITTIKVIDGGAREGALVDENYFQSSLYSKS